VRSITIYIPCEWDNTDGVDDPISLAREEGRQQCIDDPASCGITVSPTDDSATCGITVSPEDSQHAVYKPQAGELYIPFVDVPDAFGGITVYEVTLMQQPLP
jgi:hypothetical protein